MNKLIYQGKNGVLVWMVFIISNLYLSYMMIWGAISYYWILPILLMIDAIFIPVMGRNRVELYQDYMMFYYGIGKHRYELSKLKEVKKTKNPIAGSANSIDRIYLDFDGDELFVALKDNDDFIKELKKRTLSLTV